jgi:protein HokA
MSDQHQDSLLTRVMQYAAPALYCRYRNGGSEMSRKTVLYGLIVICITFLVWTWMVRASLCEVHIQGGQTQITALLNYEVRS